MAKYRKKPVVIEAWPENDLPGEIREALKYTPEGDRFCPTLEGDHKISPGDMIIRGVKGEIYPCKGEIFAMTYEPAP